MTDEREPECCCGEPDVYDGWAECEVHPEPMLTPEQGALADAVMRGEVVSAPSERYYPPLTGPLPRLRLVK